jgi:hypothetical protein
VAIGNADTIDVAYITLTAKTSGSGTTCNAKMRAEDADDAGAPANHTAYDLITWTGAVEAWNGLPSFVDGNPYDTPSIVSVVQEVVDRGGWSSNNAMLYRVGDEDESSSTDANRTASMREEDTAEAPKLHVEFTAGGEGSLPPVPPISPQLRHLLNR